MEMDAKSNPLLVKAIDDISKLIVGDVIYAGLPHFFCLFGRDSIITSLQLLDFNPQIAKGTLRTLAKLQGRKFDSLTEEEPGKILHEYRQGTDAKAYKWPFPYFGTIDATPLYLILLTEYERKTGDMALVRELWENALWALNWLEYCGDLDNDYFVEYERKNPAGLLNQGWKDSWDGIHHPDGELANPPVALVEVQGYTYRALMGMHYLASKLGLTWSHLLKDRADELRRRFIKAFWIADKKYFCLGLDEHKRQIKTVSSNAGHLLFSEIVDQEQAKYLAERLMSPELFSGWGIRTVSVNSRRYDPSSYHNGSVWFHDNWLILKGFERYGFWNEARILRRSLIDAAMLLGYIPELFCGTRRLISSLPTSYPDACHTQAWSAGTIINILMEERKA